MWRSRWFALVLLCTGMLMVILDGTIVAVALPEIQDDLGFAAHQLSWVANAYMIAFGGLLLLAGRLGDLMGRKRIFVAGLIVFTVASLACGLAQDSSALVAARFLQGAGAALASGVSLGIIVTLFPETAERARALGAYSFTGAIGASVGLALGGVLTETLGWRWVFLVNLPVGLLAAALALMVLVADRGLGWRAGADVPGAVLATAGLMVGVYAIGGVSEHGWGAGVILGTGALSVLLLAGFVLRQLRTARPLLPPRVLAPRAVWGANVVQLLTVAAMFGFQFLVVLFMQQVWGYGPLAAGLAMLPSALAIGVVSLWLGPRFITRWGERGPLLAGLMMLVAGLAWLARVPETGSYATDLLPVMLLAGGFGLVQPALTSLGMSAATTDDAGLVSGVFNTSQQVGGAVGLAVLSTLAAWRTAELDAQAARQSEALASGFQLAFAGGTALLLAAVALSILVFRTLSQRPARPGPATRSAAPHGDPGRPGGDPAVGHPG